MRVCEWVSLWKDGFPDLQRWSVRGRAIDNIRLCLLQIDENAFQFIYRNHEVLYIDHYLGDLTQVLERVDLVTYVFRDMRDQ